MTDFPGAVVLPPVISTASQYSFGTTWISIMPTPAVPASTVWPTANLGIFVPLMLPGPFVVRSLFCLNGATANGNLDIGVFSPDGALIVSKGSTAQTGTSTLQILTVTETILSPGRYLLALSCSSTSATFLRMNAGVPPQQAGGVNQAASQLPLAANPTFATPANAYVPVFGMASITTY